MYRKTDNKMPPHTGNSRRDFIKKITAATAISQIGWWTACDIHEDILSRKQYRLVTTVQNILFPSDENSPGAADFHAGEHLLWVLQDPHADREEIDFLIHGIDYFLNFSRKTFPDTDFNNLPETQQHAVIRKFSTIDTGEIWLSRILTLIIEAMISDPIYGFNQNASGWKWLDHIAGKPRPDRAHKYDEIFHTVNRNG